MYSAEPRLVAQRRALNNFVKSRAARFDLLRYEPWTHETAKNYPVRIEESRLLPGTLGVFQNSKLATKEHTYLASYPGVLMWTELHNSFTRLWHCPTAVRIGVLDYEVDEDTASQMTIDANEHGKYIVRIVLVGDPTHVGSIFNSPLGLNCRPNAKLQTCQKKDVRKYVEEISNGKQRVDASIAHVTRWKDRQKPAADFKRTELLLSYDNTDWQPDDSDEERDDLESDEEGFWKCVSTAQPHCEVCMGKSHFDGDGTLYVCSNSPIGDLCSERAGCHQGCFLPDDKSYLKPHWYCTRHTLPRFAPAQQSQVFGYSPDQATLNKESTSRSSQSSSVSKKLKMSPRLIAKSSTRSLSLLSRCNRQIESDSANVFGYTPPRVSSSVTASSDQVRPGPGDIVSPLPPSRAVTMNLQAAFSATATGPYFPIRTPSVATHTDSCSQQSRMNASATPMQLNESHPLDFDDCDEIISPKHSDEESTWNSDSNADLSDVSSDSNSESVEEADHDEVTVSRTAFGQRSQAKPLATRTLTMPKQHRESASTLSLAGKEEIRRIWRDFLPSIRRGTPRARWPIDSDSDPKKETRYNDQLVTALHNILHCCATQEKIIDRTVELRRTDPKASIIVMFTSHARLLESRLAHFQGHKYCKSARKKEVETFLDSSATHFCWRGTLDLCVSCYALALGPGFSRTSMFRRREAPDYEIDRIERVKPIVAALAEQLVEYARSSHQVDPTGSRSNQSDGSYREALIVSESTQAACRTNLQERLTENSSGPVNISKSSFQRAIAYAKNELKVVINMKKSKGMARCVRCETLDNKIDHWKRKRVATKMEEYEMKKVMHNRRWKGQRQHWDQQKQHALRAPWEMHAISLDGMDQSKTNLPHYARLTKHEHVSMQLKMRVVGAFCFGGPRPCMGITSFENVHAKGGDGAITALDMILDQQWTMMDEKRWAPIPTSAFESAHIPADVFVEARSNDVGMHPADFDADMHWIERDEEQKESDGDVVMRLVDAQPAVPARPIASFMWPKRLHVTFDNTSGDCKNSQTFTYLAMLVGVGVFHDITVSNLLVGHTHDIVDQMFSVWATKLTETNAPTLSEMHKLFREKYSSKIYALEELRSEIQKQETSRQTRVKSSGSSKSRSSASVASESTNHAAREAALSPIAGRLVELAREFGVQPNMHHQSLTVNGGNWSLLSIASISTPHNFLIRREPILELGTTKIVDYEVVMYSKWLARSTETSTEIHHAYAHIPGGWTSKIVLFRSLAEITQSDPICRPLKPIETSLIKLCITQHLEGEFNMTIEQAAELTAMLDHMDVDQAKLATDCPQCHQHQKELKKVGAISAKTKKSTEAEIAQIKQQTAKKRTLDKAQSQHLAETPHPKLDGWWTKWLQRVKRTITPYYLARGIAIDPNAVIDSDELRDETHPDRLPAEPGSVPLRERREDFECWDERGPPRVGQFIIARGNKLTSPFWIGKIVALEYDHTELERQSRSNWQAEDDAAAAASSCVPAAAAAASSQKAPTSRPARKVAAHTSYVDMEDSVVPKQTRISKKLVASKQRRRTAVDSNSESDFDEESDSESEFDSESESNAEDDDSNSDGPLDLEPDSATLTGTSNKRRRAVDSNAAASKAPRIDQVPAAASSAVALATVTRESKHARHRARRTTKSAPKKPPVVVGMAVHWWNWKENATNKALDLDNEDAWDQYVASVMQRDDLPLAESVELSEWDLTKLKYVEYSAGMLDIFPRVPKCILERWQPVEFREMSFRSIGVISSVQLTQTIIWGSDLLCESGKLKEVAFRKIISDLTEPNAPKQQFLSTEQPPQSIPPAKSPPRGSKTDEKSRTLKK